MSCRMANALNGKMYCRSTLRSVTVPRLSRFQKSEAVGHRRNGVVQKAKKGIHPEFHNEAKVYCNGEEVFAVGGVSETYDVDIWAGNHPFFQGGGSSTLVDEGHVNKFKDKFGDLGEFGSVTDAVPGGGEAALKEFKDKMKKKKQGNMKKRR